MDSPVGRPAGRAPMSIGAPSRRRRLLIGVGVAIAMLTVIIASAAIFLAAGGGATAHYAKGAATVDARQLDGVGTVLVSGDGKPLYAFEGDHAQKVTCTGLCTQDWPPYVLSDGSTVHAGSGVDAAQLGTMPNPGGGRVVTYHGSPLYTFGSDGSASRAKGQGKNAYGGHWYVMTTSGQLQGKR